MEPQRDPELDPSLVRGLTQPRISRRQLFKYAGAGASALGISALLNACAVSGTAPSAGSTPKVSPESFWKQHVQPTGEFVFANWPYYIDRVKGGDHPSLDQFTKDTGIKVTYKPAIQDNASFFATLRPQLQAGQDTGWDLMVLTNGFELTELQQFGWLIPIDHSAMPNFDKYASDLVTNPAWDPGNKYSMAWQSGLTGMAYSPKAVEVLGFEPHTIADLWNPKLKGHVGMMSDNTELGSAGLLKLGIDPATSTKSDWDKAAAVLNQQREAGIVRNYYDQSYINAFENGDTWLTMAWSGDIFQATQIGYPEVKFVVPDEGVMFWTDNMIIPANAQHPRDAMTYMDYVYQPDIQAEIANWVWYITPVPDTQPIIANQLHDQIVADSPLVFPDQQMLSNTVNYYEFKGAEDHSVWNSVFQPIINS